MYYQEQHTSISTSPYTTVYYIKVVVGTNWKGKVSSSFQNGFGPQAVVVLLVASPNATSIYGDTKLRSCIHVCGGGRLARCSMGSGKERGSQGMRKKGGGNRKGSRGEGKRGVMGR